MKSNWLFFNLAACNILGLTGCLDVPESVMQAPSIHNPPTAEVSEQPVLYQYGLEQGVLEQNTLEQDTLEQGVVEQPANHQEYVDSDISGISAQEERDSIETAINPAQLPVNAQDKEHKAGNLTLDIHLLKKNHLLTHHFPLQPEMIQAGRELHVSYRCLQCKARKTAYLWWIDVNRNGEYESGEPLRSKTKSYKIQMKDRGQRLALKVSIQSSAYNELTSHRFYEVLFQQQNRLW